MSSKAEFQMETKHSEPINLTMHGCQMAKIRLEKNGGSCNGRCWHILWPFGQFTAIWYILWLFGIYLPFWYVVRRKIWQLWHLVSM
jgi:hypothetical protein